MLRDLTQSRDHLQKIAEWSHLLDLLELGVEVIERELRLEELPRLLFRGLLIDVFLRALDEGEDVAHPEDPLREAVGVEDLDRVELLAGADQLDRHARHGANGERCASTRVAVGFREDETGERKPRVERGRALAAWMRRPPPRSRPSSLHRCEADPPCRR